MKLRIFITIIVFQFAALSLAAQTTEFSFQGSLKDGANPATGNYDFEFRLFDAAAGGSQLGILARNGVAVSNGIFSVSLDFGSPFTGADRYLEIGVRLAGGGGLTTLSPRQKVASSPYSIKSITAETANTANTAINATNASNATNATTANNALSLGGVAAGQYVLTGDARLSDARNPLPGSPNYVQPNDPRLTDARNPLPGSTNYVQNSAAQQSSSNFNISGNGTAGGTLSGNAVNAATQYNIGGSRVLSTGTSNLNNLFAGVGAGNSNTPGYENSFFGKNAGSYATGGYNSFFGSGAGYLNSGGSQNSFFGAAAGQNTGGSGNSFFGLNAGSSNMNGYNNTLVGASTDVGPGNLTFATALGSGAIVSISNTIVLGRGNGSDTVDVPGKLQIDTLATAGNINLCLNASNRVGTCSSSLRYKTNLAPYRNGLSIINQLRPITFDWKDGGMHDLGFGAEDVAKVDPLLVTHNAKGEVEGVKYDRISAVLVNAVRQQQKQIAAQQKQINALKRLVCASNRKAGTCKER